MEQLVFDSLDRRTIVRSLGDDEEMERLAATIAAHDGPRQTYYPEAIVLPENAVIDWHAQLNRCRRDGAAVIAISDPLKQGKWGVPWGCVAAAPFGEGRARLYINHLRDGYPEAKDAAAAAMLLVRQWCADNGLVLGEVMPQTQEVGVWTTV